MNQKFKVRKQSRNGVGPRLQVRLCQAVEKQIRLCQAVENQKNLLRIKTAFRNSRLKNFNYILDIILYLMQYNFIKYI